MFKPVDTIIIKCLDHHTSSDDMFIKAIKDLYNVEGICKILNINRNRYYYLVSIGEINKEILKLRKEVK